MSCKIEFRDVHKSFSGKPVLRGINLQVFAGEVLFVVGTSGVGKSVTIKTLIGLLRPDAGSVFFDSERVDQLSERGLYSMRKRCAMVFQHATLFDSMTLRENVALPLRKHTDLSEAEIAAEAKKRLEEVHLQDFSDALPATLGDGIRKRAAIARSLALNPECVLFDEPTTGLDPVSGRRIDRLIRELSDARQVTSLVVSHDLTSIATIADRVALLYQGRVHAVGNLAELRKKNDPIIEQFFSGNARGPMETPGF